MSEIPINSTMGFKMTEFSGRFSNRYQNSADDMDMWGGGGGFTGGGGSRIDTWGGPGGAGVYWDQGNGLQGWIYLTKQQGRGPCQGFFTKFI